MIGTVVVDRKVWLQVLVGGGGGPKDEHDGVEELAMKDVNVKTLQIIATIQVPMQRLQLECMLNQQN